MADALSSSDVMRQFELAPKDWADPWVVQYCMRRDPPVPWTARLEPPCSSFSMNRNPAKFTESALTDFIRQIIGSWKFMLKLPSLSDKADGGKGMFDMPEVFSKTGNSSPYLDLHIDAGFGVFRIIPPPANGVGQLRIMDPNYGAFPADVPSLRLQY